ncbi:MAG: tRNA adenosine(34) deaminase TadA [Desulfobacterales bacterium]|jgi:tRNA(adenine34) deaminase|nr:tRNA adenosine(34) deaminase TadA [Desulfobacterales bacterium]
MEPHIDYMRLALQEAKKAGQFDEVPVGAVLVSEAGEVLAAARNRTIELCDPTAHAEVIALREAAGKIRNYRLLNTTLYVTIEPCHMCMGALIHARVALLVFGATDPKWGAAGSLYNLAQDRRLNHQIEVIAGVCEPECRKLVQEFFRLKRMAK